MATMFAMFECALASSLSSVCSDRRMVVMRPFGGAARIRCSILSTGV